MKTSASSTHVAHVAHVAILALLVGCAPLPLAEQSVRPGINESFLDPELEPAKLQERFEGESREIYAQRHRIASQVGLREGMAVADVGAGTGLFLDLFAKLVGAGGKVYAVDISPKLIRFMRDRIARKGLNQVEAVLCSERSAELEPASVDVVFICDTYHHFEYPHSTMTSIHRALKPGGALVVVDFERIPGTSRQWVLDHVRAGKQTVIEEIESVGFRYDTETPVKGLRENYVIRFRRE